MTMFFVRPGACMTIPFRKTVMLLAFSAISTLALADTPARVGRIALTQGPVNISSEVGEEAAAALVNWPVTSSNQIVTQRNGRTEIRVGSTSVRLDGDSALDVVELDDDTLRLHLHYGSLSLRVRNPEALRGLEISTPQGLVRMKEAGRLRIDSERVRDTTTVSVFEGTAQVDGGGSSLAVRAGRRVDVHEDDVRTAQAQRDSFDDWSLQRDERDARTTADRYVTTEMTGYEELDQYGAWRDDSEYGPLWTPRSVAADWVPYRDGRWTYLAPWGWTWVDNAPWGYAPSHYGRWVMVRQRWSWAPGRNIGRPVWAPALVGWVGGNSWNLAFNDNGTRRNAPAQGWYPLNPGESYVPGYHLPPEHLRHHNRHARPDYRPGRHDGLTVVGLNLFAGRDQIVVPRAPRPVLAPLPTQSLPFAAPPRPQGNWPTRFERDGRADRVLTSPTTGAQTVVPFSRREGRLSDNERLVRNPPQVLTVTEPQRSLAEKDRRQREAEIERRERDQANERRLREVEADARRSADTQQRMRDADLAERRREAEADRQRSAQGDRQRALEGERRQREAEAQQQAQRDAQDRQQAERQQREANNRQLADRLQRDADQERLRQVERQQQADRQQQAERQQRDAENARRQQAERQQHDAENARRQQAERQQRDAQQREAQQREAQQRDAAQREAAQAQARQAQQQQAQQQAQQQQQQQQKQAEEADKRERAREQRQDRRDNVQQQIR
jgi:DNA segregation ATPase FtsK/SpoIIIE-like protein